jgi:hypothetical protein
MPNKKPMTMIEKFDEYVMEVDRCFEAVRNALDNQRWQDAADAMTAITQRQGQTSLGMRSSFIKAGLIKDDR